MKISNGVNKIFNFQFSIFNKINFFLRKPKVVIVAGQNRQLAKEAIFQILKQYFKLGKDVFIFEAEEKKINKFVFYLKNSRLPLLVISGLSQALSAKKLPANTYFVLNYDDEKIKRNIKDFDNFKIMKFGLEEGKESKLSFSPSAFAREKNDIFASDIKENRGTNFKVNYDGKIVPFWLQGPFGKEQIYAVLSAISAATILGLNLVEISQSLKKV